MCVAYRTVVLNSLFSVDKKRTLNTVAKLVVFVDETGIPGTVVMDIFCTQDSQVLCLINNTRLRTFPKSYIVNVFTCCLLVWFCLIAWGEGQSFVHLYFPLASSRCV